MKNRDFDNNISAIFEKNTISTIFCNLSQENQINTLFFCIKIAIFGIKLQFLSTIVCNLIIENCNFMRFLLQVDELHAINVQKVR